MFDVKTMNGSLVTAKIAGIESTAKTRSVHSISTSTRSSGVATRLPSCRIVKRGAVVLGDRGHEARGTAGRPGCAPGAMPSSRCTKQLDRR